MTNIFELVSRESVAQMVKKVGSQIIMDQFLKSNSLYLKIYTDLLNQKSDYEFKNSYILSTKFKRIKTLEIILAPSSIDYSAKNLSPHTQIIVRIHFQDAIKGKASKKSFISIKINEAVSRPTDFGGISSAG